MLRTDHCYPPTVHAPLGPPIVEHHFEAITMPAPLPPIVEPLAPSRACGTDTCRQGRGVPCVNGCIEPRVLVTEEKFDELMRQPRVWAPYQVTPHTEPPRPVPWLACAAGAALFAVGYLLGRFLP